MVIVLLALLVQTDLVVQRLTRRVGSEARRLGPFSWHSRDSRHCRWLFFVGQMHEGWWPREFGQHRQEELLRRLEDVREVYHERCRQIRNKALLEASSFMYVGFTTDQWRRGWQPQSQARTYLVEHADVARANVFVQVTIEPSNCWRSERLILKRQ